MIYYIPLQSSSLRALASDVSVNAGVFARPDEEVSSSTVTTDVSEDSTTGGEYTTNRLFIGKIK